MDSQCPEGFVIPDHPSDGRVEWITNSSCAYSCLSPIYTKDEWVVLDKLSRTLTIIGFIAVSASIIYLLLWKERNKNYLFLISAIFSWIATLSFMLMIRMSFEKSHCEDNAVRIDYTDGFNYCTLQSFLLFYSFTGMSLCWCLQCVNMCRTAVMKATIAPWEQKYCMMLIFILPIIPLYFLYVDKTYGYRKSRYTCWASDVADHKHLGVIRLYMTMLIFVIIGLIAFGMVCIQVLVLFRRLRKVAAVIAPNEAEDNTILQSTRLLSALKFPLFHVATFALFWCYLFAMSLDQMRKNGLYEKSLKEWSDCVFIKYDGRDQNSWKLACGEHPEHRLHVLHRYALTAIATFAHAFIFSISTFSLPVLDPHLQLKRNYRLLRNNINILRHKLLPIRRHFVSQSIQELDEDAFWARYNSLMSKMRHNNDPISGLPQHNDCMQLMNSNKNGSSKISVLRKSQLEQDSTNNFHLIVNTVGDTCNENIRYNAIDARNIAVSSTDSRTRALRLGIQDDNNCENDNVKSNE